VSRDGAYGSGGDVQGVRIQRLHWTEAGCESRRFYWHEPRFIFAVIGSLGVAFDGRTIYLAMVPA